MTAFYLLPQIALHPQFAIEPELTQRVAALLARLEAPEAAQRDAAAKELAQIGPVAWRALRDALKKARSPRAARQMNEILKNTDATDWLRQATKTYGF